MIFSSVRFRHNHILDLMEVRGGQSTLARALSTFFCYITPDCGRME